MAREHHIGVSRTARYFTIGEIGERVRDVWLVCHGYSELASDFIRSFEPMARDDRLIIAPEALSRFYLAETNRLHASDDKVGASWMTREDREHEIEDYVRYLDAVYDEVFSAIRRDSVCVTVLGFSQGGATANRWLTRGTARADRLIMWGCLLPFDADLNDAAQFFREVALTLVYGSRDRFAETGMMRDYEARLHASDVPFTVVTFEGGHRLDSATLLRLAQ